MKDLLDLLFILGIDFAGVVALIVCTGVKMVFFTAEEVSTTFG